MGITAAAVAAAASAAATSAATGATVATITTAAKGGSVKDVAKAGAIGAGVGAISGAAGSVVGGAAGGAAGGTAGGSAANASNAVAPMAGATMAEAPASTGAMGGLSGVVSGPSTSAAPTATSSVAQSGGSFAKDLMDTVVRPLAGEGKQWAHTGARLGAMSQGGNPSQSLASMAAGGQFAPANAAITGGTGGQYLQQAYNLYKSQPVQMATQLLENKQSGPVPAPMPTGRISPEELRPKTETNLGRRKYTINQQGFLVRV